MTTQPLMNRWQAVSIALTAILFGALFIACGTESAIDEAAVSPKLDESIFNDPRITDESPRLRILLTDKPVDGIDNVWLTVSSVSVREQSQGWMTVSNSLQTMDLLGLRYGVTHTLGISGIPAGTYEEIRLVVSDSSVVVDGETHDLFIPSGSSSGVKIKFHFTVSDEELSTMLIDWDASASIHYAPGSGYILRPNIEVRTFRTEEMDNEMPPAPVVDSPSHPSNDNWYSENDVDFHWVGTDNVGVDGFSYTMDQIPNSIPDEVIDTTKEDTEAQDCQPSLYPDAPQCFEFEPSVVLRGGLLTIYGANFGRWTSTVDVTIGDTLAEIVQVTPASITVRVLDTMGSFPVEVSTPKGSVKCDQTLEIVGDSSFCPDGEYEVGKGLLGRVFEVCEGQHNHSCYLPDFDTMGEPQSTIVACTLDVPNHYFSEGFPGVDETLVEWFGITFDAVLVVPTSGTYKFRLAADDGANLYIDGSKVIDNDGLHPVRSKSAEIYLTAGQHDFQVDYFQGPRWYIALQIFWTPPGGSEHIIPKDYFLMPSKTEEYAASQTTCFCSGEGAGAYNYRAWAANDGDAKLYYLDMYADDAEPVLVGTIKGGSQNRTLTDFESLAILDGVFYGVNNKSNKSSIDNRLYKVLVNQAEDGVIPTETIGVLKHNGSTIQDVDCLAFGPDDLLYGISTNKNKLYTIDLETAEMTYVMNVTGNIEGCAFGASGLMYGIDNDGSGSKLVQIDVSNHLIEDVAVLPYETDVESLGWHPDGYLYAGIDNSSNSYPSIAKIRPLDGVVVETMDPSIKWNDIEGFDFNYAEEEATCACDYELVEDTAISATGSFRISDHDNDGFSELIEFIGDQILLGADPASDPLSAYTGMNASCGKPKARITIHSIELDPSDYVGNRFALAQTIHPDGFALELLRPDCSYETAVLADVQTTTERLWLNGNRGQFWIKLIDATVTTALNSPFLRALAAQDEPAVVMFNLEESAPCSMQQKVKTGRTMEGSHSLTIQPGADLVGSGTETLPICPDPVLHETPKEGSASYRDVDDGIWFFHVRSVDDAGNWGDAAHYRVKIDSTPPDPPVIASTTHISQEIEYINTDPVFEWTQNDLSGIAGYSYLIDDQPATDPDQNVDGSDNSTSYNNVEGEVLYFHVKGVNGSGVWSQPAHYKIMIREEKDERPVPPPGYAYQEHVVYNMGSPAAHGDRFSDEKAHWVEVGEYFIMQEEVTNDEYRDCVAKYRASDESCTGDADCGDNMYCNSGGFCASGCENAPHEQASYHKSSMGNHPVAYITWNDAKNFCRTNGQRLPTEAEWEYAARGGDSERYPWGDSYDEDLVNGIDSGLHQTANVGSYEEGSNCIDDRCLHDMAGNVEEWVSDYFHTYHDAESEDNPVQFPDIDTRSECTDTCAGDSMCIAYCDMKVTRGGSFLSDSRRLRVFYRNKLPTHFQGDNVGFRCAKDVEDSSSDPVVEICDGVDNDGDGQIDEGFDDADSDGSADCVDDDDDNDGVADEADNCPFAANSDQADPDMDGYGEVCDPDGENLDEEYLGLLRPWDVAIADDGTIFVAGSTDGYALNSYGINALGAVQSINSLGQRTGQVQLTDTTSASTNSEDFRPNKLSLSPLGHLYMTDSGGSYDDGIWKVVPKSINNQLGSSVAPAGRNGQSGSTERYWAGDPNERGIDNTSGNAMSADGQYFYVTRGNSKKVQRFSVTEGGDISAANGKNGLRISNHNRYVYAPAVDSSGNLYYMRGGKLVRQRMIGGLLQNYETLSDSAAFVNAVALEFDDDDNLWVLSARGISNIWPFTGSAVDRNVPADSGYISRVAKTVLDSANSSNLIRHGDESKQVLVYGGSSSREIAYDGKRLSNPLGFDIDEESGNIVVANTDEDEVLVLSPSRGMVTATVSTDGVFMGLE